MEKQVQKQQAEEWHYEEKGQRLGPVPETEVKQLIDAGKLTYGDLVWQKGLTDWITLEDSTLGEHLMATQPPPLSGNKVNNTVIWILAFAPLIGLFLEYIVAGMFHKSDAAIDNAVMDGNYWFVTLLLNVGLSYLDEKRLRKAGYNTDKFRGMVWLVPVYLYQRAKCLKQNNAYFIVWLVCFILMFFG